MKQSTLKLISTLFIIFFFFKVHAEPFLTIQFSDKNVPQITSDGETYILTFEDPELTDIFHLYIIKEFEKKYPSALSFTHPNAETLDRVYNLFTSDYKDLYNVLSSSQHTSIEAFYIDDSGPILLYTPVDYNNYPTCSFHGYTTTSASSPLDLINAQQAWDISQAPVLLDISGLSSGMYMLQMLTAQSTKVEKLIIK